MVRNGLFLIYSSFQVLKAAVTHPTYLFYKHPLRNKLFDLHYIYLRHLALGSQQKLTYQLAQYG